jgi:hypothetical protein
MSYTSEREERIAFLKTIIPVGFRLATSTDKVNDCYFWDYAGPSSFNLGTWESAHDRDYCNCAALGTIFVIAENVIPEAPLPVEVV